MHRIKPLICIFTLLFLSACSTSNHGTFVASTYLTQDDKTDAKLAGKVTGESRQSRFLYIFPLGAPPSTSEAILDAKSKIKNTKFLTDISIDDKTYWGFGYSEQVIIIEATAYH